MASLTCSWRSAALPAGCEIYEFAGPKIKRQLEAAATFNSNNATKRGQERGEVDYSFPPVPLSLNCI